MKELDFIEQIRRRSGSRPNDLRIGIGDDAAVWAGDPNTETLLTTDLLAEDVHFRLEQTPCGLLGEKALAVNLSDIAAMGGRARFVTLSLAIPAGLPRNFLDEFADGFLRGCGEHEVQLIGGDVSSSRSGLIISVTAVGSCGKGRAVSRSSARAGDRILVSGALGGSAAGLRLLEAGRRIGDAGAGAEAQLMQAAIRFHLCPRPRLQLGAALGERGVATSMIDISDGLSSDLNHITIESGAGAVITAEAIPISPAAVLFGSEALNLALHGGEDYELLFTAPRGRVAEALALDEGIREIGEIVSEPGLWIQEAGVTKELVPSGYEHEWNEL